MHFIDKSWKCLMLPSLLQNLISKLKAYNREKKFHVTHYKRKEEIIYLDIN